MEEIKVGEYFRTNTGYIDKLNTYWLFNDKYKKLNITKHSFNIIDLIEEGDYVNGERVLQKTKIKDGSMQICILKDNNSSNWRTINNFTLKNIVTKEQFNQVKYEV